MIVLLALAAVWLVLAGLALLFISSASERREPRRHH